MTNEITGRLVGKGIIGRLVDRPYQEGDDLPAVGSTTLVSGAHGDVDNDQHRCYGWRLVLGYSPDLKFICLQTPGCWPTVDRLQNCWFAEIRVTRAEIGERLIDASAAKAALVEAASRANGQHSAPHDCYSTGPLTGDPILDLVACPGCALATAIARAKG